MKFKEIHIDYLHQLKERCLYECELIAILTFHDGDYIDQLTHGVEKETDLMTKYSIVVFSLRDKKLL